MEIGYEVLSTVLSTTTTLLITGFFLHTKRAYKRILNQLTLARIDIQAMDYALEMESDNGYCKSRDTKREELIRNENFIDRVN